MKDGLTRQFVKRAAEAIYKEIVRKKIAIDKNRPDGRDPEEIRPIECEVGVSPRTHGSALFQRGQTQIMSLLTLGTAKEGQRIDDLSLEEERRYMHHYNFPPYSVGETGFMRGPKRRDIGHGALAQRALEPVIPTPDEFPYTIRIVSETLESNGSSSMGSVCGSTLSLYDAGVPIKAPVSGIAMGLVKEGDDYVILTDIQGAEDHLGDMDFKVAGSRNGITALQMDIKITGVTQQIMSDALAQAKRARDTILDKMLEAIPEPRQELEGSRAAHLVDQDQPRVHRDGDRQGRRDDPFARVGLRRPDRHRGGRHDPHLRDGRGSGPRPRSQRSARSRRDPEAGDQYTGKVVKTTDFGAFVELKKGTDGLLHVSNVGPGRVGHIEDVIARGDVLDVIVQEVDKDRGRIGLKLVAKHENGTLVQPEELIERAKDAPPREPREERPRGGDRAAAAAAATAARAATSADARRERAPRGALSRYGRDDDDRRAEVDVLEQPLGVGDPHADAAVRGRVADRRGVGRAVDAHEPAVQPHPARAERVARSRRHGLQPLRPVRARRVPPGVVLLVGDRRTCRAASGSATGPSQRRAGGRAVRPVVEVERLRPRRITITDPTRRFAGVTRKTGRTGSRCAVRTAAVIARSGLAKVEPTSRDGRPRRRGRSFASRPASRASTGRRASVGARRVT